MSFNLQHWLFSNLPQPRSCHTTVSYLRSWSLEGRGTLSVMLVSPWHPNRALCTHIHSWVHEKCLCEQTRSVSLGKPTNLILVFREISQPRLTRWVSPQGWSDDRNVAKLSIVRKQSAKQTLSNGASFRLNSLILEKSLAHWHQTATFSVLPLCTPCSFSPNHLESAVTLLCHPLLPPELPKPGQGGSECQRWSLLKMGLFAEQLTLETTLSVGATSRQQTWMGSIIADSKQAFC